LRGGIPNKILCSPKSKHFGPQKFCAGYATDGLYDVTTATPRPRIQT